MDPKLFISYSHDSQEHKDWVLKLVVDLYKYFGVDVIFDQWDLRVGRDLAFYMEHGLTEANLVLCVCSNDYVKKANLGICGSGYEKMILTRALVTNTNIDYIIPIIRNNTQTDKLPVFLGTKFYIDFSDDNNYMNRFSELIARIYNEDLAKKPTRGENPFSKSTADFVDIKNTLEKTKYYDPHMNGTVTFNFLNNNSRFTIGLGEYEFLTAWSECGINSMYAYNDSVKQIGYISRFSEFPTTDDLKDFDYTSRSRVVSIGEVVVWVNRFGNFAATKILDIKLKRFGAKEDELSFEYKIYC